MKKPILFIILVSIAALCFVAYKGLIYLELRYPYLLMENSIEKNLETEILKVYDPSDEVPDNLQHYTLKIRANSNWHLKENEMKDMPPGQPALITIEIWGDRILKPITTGGFDQEFKKILKLFDKHEKLYLRFNPNMEIPYSGKPWANWGNFYVEAFQKFSRLVEEHLPAAQVVWSPAGSIGNMEYFPGQEYFEAAGITIGLEDETDLFLEGKSIQQKLTRKLHRMRFIDSPILVFGKNIPADSLSGLSFSSALVRFSQIKELTNASDIDPKSIPERSEKVKIGLYDPKALLLDEAEVQLEHIFLDFENLQNGLFRDQLAQALQRQNQLILTFEPMKLPNDSSGPDVLKKILAGDFDAEFQKFYRLIPDTTEVYLRFAHEMEVPVNRYPWQFQEPLLYIKAFRYFMNFPQTERRNIRKVWAPAGDRGSVDWWPGSDVVDYISMSVYGLPDKNITDFRKQDSFKEIYERKKRRLDLFGKAFLIAEFGVKGNNNYQKRWLLDAANVIENHKEIFGVSYFNQKDIPKAWGSIKPPDWSLSPEVFKTFVDKVK